jgi:osmotically-inducible protein OsmY
MLMLLGRLLPFAIGAGLAYFLDPDNGNRRRKMALDRLGGIGRTAQQRTERAASYAASQAAGTAQRVTHPMSSQEPPGDDITLARKVETEIFRPQGAPKGQVNVQAVDGIVELRGEVDDPQTIEEIVRKAEQIPGVRGVENLLHTPGTEAPTRS